MRLDSLFWGSCLCGLAGALLGGDASAEDGLDGLPVVSIHGFVSPGYILTTDGNNYLADSSGTGSVELVEAGLNFTVPLSDRLRVGLQLFTRDRGPLGNYDVKLDWFYLDYRWQDWLGLRAGRVKVPFGLYNETSDADSARVPALLPQSVYPIDNRDFLLAQTGAELYGYVTLGCAGALDYRLYGGTVFLDTTTDRDSAAAGLELEIPYLVGGRLMWETPVEGLRLGGSLQAVRLELDFEVTQPTPTDVASSIDAILWVASAEYALGDLLAAAEYSRWYTSTRSEPEVFPDDDATSERAYAMVSYRLSDVFTPGVDYSLYYRDTDDRHGRDAYQHDVALTLRFDIEEHWLLKLEGHYMNGTASLSTALNDGKNRAALAASWGTFVVKTSHDLREPIRQIDGFARILEDSPAGELDRAQGHHLARIRDATAKMSALIDDLLALSASGRKDIALRPIDLAAIARTVADELAAEAPDRQVRFVSVDEAQVDGDPGLMRIVFENLLRNTWKFTRKVPSPRVELGAGQDGGRTVYYLRDNGAGFDPALADRLFEPFRRLHAQRDFEGNGVGLAIVQRILRRHGGTIWAESTPGQGATFYFTLHDWRR